MWILIRDSNLLKDGDAIMYGNDVLKRGWFGTSDDPRYVKVIDGNIFAVDSKGDNRCCLKDKNKQENNMGWNFVSVWQSMSEIDNRSKFEKDMAEMLLS